VSTPQNWSVLSTSERSLSSLLFKSPLKQFAGTSIASSSPSIALANALLRKYRGISSMRTVSGVWLDISPAFVVSCDWLGNPLPV
jgi:hypothetical protein